MGGSSLVGGMGRRMWGVAGWLARRPPKPLSAFTLAVVFWDFPTGWGMRSDWRREIEFVERVIEKLGHNPERFLVCSCKGSVPYCCVLKVPIEWSGSIPPGVYGGFTDKRGDRLAIAGVKRVGRNKVIVTVQVRTWRAPGGWQVL